LPGTVISTAQRKQSGIEDGRQAASVQARAVIDGENAVIRWKKQQDRLHPTHPHTRCWQVRSTRRPGSTIQAEGVRDQRRMAVIRHEARGAAREPDGGTPGRTATAF